MTLPPAKPLPDDPQAGADPIQGFSPAGHLLHLITGYWVSQAIFVATELGIADLLGKKPRTVDALARETNTHAPSLYRVLRALASVGIFSEAEPQGFVQTPMSVLLRRDMPGNLGAFSRFQGDAWHWQAWAAIVDSVRTGKSAMTLRHDTPNCFEYLAHHAPSAAIFNSAMDGYSAHVNAAVADAYDFSTAQLIVDVAGGQGGLLGAILESAPQARGLLFDRAAVVSTAAPVLQQHGVADRCTTAAGNFFEGVPAGGDIYVLSSVIHDWDDQQAIAILKNVRAAIDNNGRLLIIEHVLPGGNESHPGKLIDLEMMLVTGGKERNIQEYQILMNLSGFALKRLIETGASASIIEAHCVALPPQ